jgi:hypothetical protein
MFDARQLKRYIFPQLPSACLRLDYLGTGATEAVYSMELPAAFRALEVNYLQRWSDPRLSCLPVEPVSRAVIFYGVAVHRELPGTR